MKLNKVLIALICIALISCKNKMTNIINTNPVETVVKNEQNTLFNSENVIKLDNLNITNIEKYGNIVLDIKATDFLNSGFNYEDIVTVSFFDKKIDMPVCDVYSDVDNGEYLLLAEINKEINSNKVALAINMGDFATKNQLAVKNAVDDEIIYKWDYLNGTESCTFTIELKEKGGYHEEHLAHKLVRSNNREDYKNLSDEEFANFRMIKTTGIGENKVYRSSSPVNNEIGRNIYAMKAIEEHNIKTIINLADSKQELEARETYKDSYYSKQSVFAAGLSMDFNSESFKRGIAESIHFMADNTAPYLIHCTEGKDRAGYLSALIECLMGASFDEVTEDYMITYYNFYNILPDTEQYYAVRDKFIVKQLENAFETTDLTNANLSMLCEKYLLSIGVTEEDIQSLKLKLK